MYRLFGFLLLVAAASGLVNTDKPQRHPALRKHSGLNLHAAETRYSKFATQADPTNVYRVDTSSPYMNLSPRSSEQFVQTPSLALVVLRIQMPDLQFTTEELNFDFRSFYISTGTSLGLFVNDNSYGKIRFDVVDMEAQVFTTNYTEAELLAAVAVQRLLTPDVPEEELYFNALVHEAIRQYLTIAFQTVAVYDTFAVHVPGGAVYEVAEVGKGIGIRGVQIAWRQMTFFWGGLFGIDGGAVLRDAIFNSTTNSELVPWGYFPRRDSFSGMAHAWNETALLGVDQTGHWPLHGKVSAGWVDPVTDYTTVTSTGNYTILAHNTALNRTLYSNYVIGLKVSTATNSFWVSYNNYPAYARAGATVYLVTGEVDVPYLLMDATPESDSCAQTIPGCTSGWECDCRDIDMSPVSYESVNFGQFSIRLIEVDNSVAGREMITVEVTMSSTQSCPLEDQAGPLCQSRCPGGVHACSNNGMCSNGVNGTGQCTCNTPWLGAACLEDDYCDVDHVAARDNAVLLYNYKTANSNVSHEVASDFYVIGRQGFIESMSIFGRFSGVVPYVPDQVDLTVYSSEEGFPQTVLRSVSFMKNDPAVSISLVTPGSNPTDLKVWHSVEITVSLSSNLTALDDLILTPGHYLVSAVPVLKAGESFLLDTIQASAYHGDQQRYIGPDAVAQNWTTTQNALTFAFLPKSARIYVGFNSDACIEYFTPKDHLRTLVLPVQFSDFMFTSSEAGSFHTDALGLYGVGGTLAQWLITSSNNHTAFWPHEIAGVAASTYNEFYIAPILTCAKNFSEIAMEKGYALANLADPMLRATLFDALKYEALQTARQNGIDPDLFDVHFGYYPACANASFPCDADREQRPYPTTKAVWSFGSGSKTNAVIAAFGYVLGLNAPAFLRPQTDAYLKNVIKIANGATSDGVSFSWLAENMIANPTVLTDYNAADKAALGWLPNEVVELSKVNGTTTVNVYAHNVVNQQGSTQAIKVTEPGVNHAFWIQYYKSAAMNVGVTVLYEDDYGLVTYLDGTPLTDNCPMCFTGAIGEEGCTNCSLSDITVTPMSSYYAGYIRIDVGGISNDAVGDYLPVTVTFNPDQNCPLQNTFGATCLSQCPGGEFDACSESGMCGTGQMGTGTCSCNSNTGAQCANDNTCYINYFGSDMHVIEPYNSFIPSYYDDSGLDMGPWVDISVTTPRHFDSFTFYGRSRECCPTLTGHVPLIARPTVPETVRITIRYNDGTSTPGAVWGTLEVTGREYIEMEVGSYLQSTATAVKVTVPDNDHNIRHTTIGPGNYWVQVQVKSTAMYEMMVTREMMMGSHPDMFQDVGNTLGEGASFRTATSVYLHAPMHWNDAHVETKIGIEFDLCLPTCGPLGVPHPAEILTPPYIDFQPKIVQAGETLNLTFSGYLAYGDKDFFNPECRDEGMKVKIANRLEGYGCCGEAPGGAEQILPPNLQLTFTISTPGFYSVCIKPREDMDWEEIGMEALEARFFMPSHPVNFHGFASCKSLLDTNTSACGCMYTQIGANPVDMTLPEQFEFRHMTSGVQPITVRQGCCTYVTDKTEEFPMYDSNGNPTAHKWGLCSNTPE